MKRYTSAPLPEFRNSGARVRGPVRRRKRPVRRLQHIEDVRDLAGETRALRKVHIEKLREGYPPKIAESALVRARFGASGSGASAARFFSSRARSAIVFRRQPHESPGVGLTSEDQKRPLVIC